MRNTDMAFAFCALLRIRRRASLVLLALFCSFLGAPASSEAGCTLGAVTYPFYDPGHPTYTTAVLGVGDVYNCDLSVNISVYLRRYGPGGSSIITAEYGSAGPGANYSATVGKLCVDAESQYTYEVEVNVSGSGYFQSKFSNYRQGPYFCNYTW